MRGGILLGLGCSRRAGFDWQADQRREEARRGQIKAEDLTPL